MAGLWDSLFGKESKMKPFNKVSQQALEGIAGTGGLQNNQLYNTGTDYLQNLLDNSPQAFAHFEAPYMQNFEQNIAPGIAERYAGMGTGSGALSSSGLNNSLAQAGRGLQTDLAGMRGGLQMQGLNQGLQYANQPIQNQLNAGNAIQGQYFNKEGLEGLLQQLIMKFAENGSNMMKRGYGGGF